MTVSIDVFKPFIQSDVQGCDIYTVERNLRFAITDFCEKTWILQKGFAHIVDTEDIDPDMFDSIIVSTKGVFRDHRPFAIKEFKINGVDWDLKYAEIINDTGSLEDIRGANCKIYEIFSTYLIRVAPFASSDEIYIKPVFKPLNDFTVVDDRLYDDWVEAVAAGTKWKLLDVPAKPWTNHPAANRWERIYRSKVSDARRQINKGFTGRSRHVHPREFGF